MTTSRAAREPAEEALAAPPYHCVADRRRRAEDRPAERTAGNRRCTGRRRSAWSRLRLSFIRRARELGFSLGQTRELLGLQRGHDLTCGEVRALTEQHILDVRQKIRDLRRLDRVLSELAAQCRSDRVPDCPILDALGVRS